MKKLWALVAVALLASGCASPRVYLNRDMMTAVVLAPLNDTIDRDAPWKVWKYVEAEVASRGYRIVPHEKVAAWYEARKYTADPGQIGEWNTEELAKEFGVEAVVWTKLVAWDTTTLIAYNSITVKVEAEVHDQKGEIVWKGDGSDGYTSVPSKKGIFGSFLGAALADREKYAPGAVRACFASLPWAGWDPKQPRTPETPPEPENPPAK